MELKNVICETPGQFRAECETGDTYGVCSDCGWEKVALNE